MNIWLRVVSLWLTILLYVCVLSSVEPIAVWMGDCHHTGAGAQDLDRYIYHGADLQYLLTAQPVE